MLQKLNRLFVLVVSLIFISSPFTACRLFQKTEQTSETKGTPGPKNLAPIEELLTTLLKSNADEGVAFALGKALSGSGAQNLRPKIGRYLAFFETTVNMASRGRISARNTFHVDDFSNAFSKGMNELSQTLSKAGARGTILRKQVNEEVESLLRYRDDIIDRLSKAAESVHGTVHGKLIAQDFFNEMLLTSVNRRILQAKGILKGATEVTKSSEEAATRLSQRNELFTTLLEFMMPIQRNAKNAVQDLRPHFLSLDSQGNVIRGRVMQEVASESSDLSKQISSALDKADDELGKLQRLINEVPETSSLVAGDIAQLRETVIVLQSLKKSGAGVVFEHAGGKINLKNLDEVQKNWALLLAAGKKSPQAAQKLKTKAMVAGREDENIPGNAFSGRFGQSAVQYFTNSERQVYKLSFCMRESYKLLCDAAGNVFDSSAASSAHNGKGFAIFVVDEFGNIYAAVKHEVGKFHHSTFMAGRPVAMAGEIKVSKGFLEVITNESGHYQPGGELVEQFINGLKREQLYFGHGATKRVCCDAHNKVMTSNVF